MTPHQILTFIEDPFQNSEQDGNMMLSPLFLSISMFFASFFMSCLFTILQTMFWVFGCQWFYSWMVEWWQVSRESPKLGTGLISPKLKAWTSYIDISGLKLLFFWGAGLSRQCSHKWNEYECTFEWTLSNLILCLFWKSFIL